MPNTSKSRKRYDSNGKSLRLHESQKKTGTYQYAYKDATGHWCRISAPTLEKLREKEKQVEHNAYIGLKIDGKSSVNRYFDIWIKSHPGIRRQTKSLYTHIYNSNVRNSIIGNQSISTVKHSDILQLYAHIEKEKSAYSVKATQTVLRQVFDLACKDNILFRNPCDGAVKNIRKEINKSTRDPLTQSEQQRLYEYLNTSTYQVDIRNKHLIIILLETGLRASELCALTWSDIDFTHHIINIKHSLVVYYDKKPVSRHLGPTKTPAGVRSIPMTSNVQTAFNELYKHKKSIHTAIDNATDFVFVSNRNFVYTKEGIRDILQNIINRCNLDTLEYNSTHDDKKPILPSISPHFLRHTFCTNLILSGANIKSVQYLMGHDDIKITLDIYSKCRQDTIDDAIKTLENWQSKTLL